MNVDEIKQQYSMSDILMRYGIKSKGVRKNISCPFHGKDKNPSMQIFYDGFKCHTCNANGDIFKFVQLMENISFKDAFLSLGGEYEQKQDTAEYQKRRKELELKWKLDRERKEYEKTVREFIPNEMVFYRNECKKYEPFSDPWCFCKELQCQLEILFDEIFQRKKQFDLEEVFKKYFPIKEVYQDVIKLRKDNGNE